MHQVLWRIPIITEYTPDGLPIYGFGMMLFLAFLICTWMAGKRGEQEGISRETIQDLAIWLFVGGLLGARLTYLLQDSTTKDLWDLIVKLPRIWDGGIILYGSVLGGLAGYVAAYYLVFRKQGLSTARLADAIAPAFAVGLALGRTGCFLNGCCYGGVACASSLLVLPTPFPLAAPPREGLVIAGWQTSAGFTLASSTRPGDEATVGAVEPGSPAYRAGLRPGDIITAVNGITLEPKHTIHDALGQLDRWRRGDSEVRLEYLAGGQGEAKTLAFTPWTLGLYPTQLYEVVSMVLLFLVLTAYYPLRKHPGQVMAVMMLGYGLHRYLNEILRDDPRPKGFESYGSVLLIVSGVLLWVYLEAKPAGSDRLGTPSGAAPSPA